MSVQSISETLFNKYVVISVGSVIAVIGIVKIYTKRQRYLRRKAYPRDLVILHQYPRGLQVPSASPYVLKLETWLRMVDIKYQNEFGFEFGPKGKLPFITYNGEDMGDSDFIIHYLSKKYGKDLSKDFSLSDQGIARAFSKLVEESLVWVMALQRLVYAPDPKLTGIPYLVLLYFGRLIRNRSKAQGYGLHSQEEVYSIGRKDIKSINDFLDGKQFLLGDRPCNEDAALFGTICQILYVEDGPMNKFINGECPNILSYVDRIKSTYWPDWDKCITSKKSKKNE